MNCYAGFATRIVNSCFPRVIPVPQLQPLDARKIFYASPDEEVWKATLVWEEASSSEDAWKVALAWAEAKAQEREATALKAVSETDTNESYDADDDDFGDFGVPIQPVRNKSALFGGDDEDSSGDESGVYEGERNAAGQMEGRGIYRWADGDVYEGEWKAGNMEGRGIYRFADGDVYDGEFKADKREGRGIDRYASGSVYEGEWNADKMEGRGKYVFANGAFYEGEFNADKREGHGIYRFANGNVYEGEFNADKMEGRGIYRFADGDVYEGEFKADKMEGRGIYRYADGAVYEGKWKADEYYDSDFEDDFNDRPSAMAGLMRVGAVSAKAESLGDAAAAAAMWRDDAQADADESVAVTEAMDALDKRVPSPRKYKAATIIQAAARGRALRAWKAQFTDELVREMSHIWRPLSIMDAVEQQWAEQWMVSPKCVKAWILQGEQRSASADLPHVSVICIQ